MKMQKNALATTNAKVADKNAWFYVAAEENILLLYKK